MLIRYISQAQEAELRRLLYKLELQAEDFVFIHTSRTQIVSKLYAHEASKLIGILKTLDQADETDNEKSERLLKEVYDTLEAISVYAPKLKTKYATIDLAQVNRFLESTPLQKGLYELSTQELETVVQLFKELLTRYMRKN